MPVPVDPPTSVSVEHQLLALNADLTLRNAALAEQVTELTKKLEAAIYRIDQMARKIFGRSSERYDSPDQQRIDLGDLTPAAPAGPVTVIPPGAKGIVSGKVVVAGKAKRKPIPDHLEVIVMPLQELPLEQRVLPDGRQLPQIGVITEERLHMIPAHFQKHVFPKAIYGLPDTTQPLLKAPAVPQIIPDGIPTTQTLISIEHAKYELHLPLHRQAKEYQRMGVDIAKSTMCGWLAAFADFLTGVNQAMRSQVLSQSLLYTDDIPVAMLDSSGEKGKAIQARFWSYCDGQQVFFEFTQDRRGIHPSQTLAHYHGALMADALAQYNAIVELNGMWRLGCWSHVRRKFYEARLTDIRCQEMVLLIRKLFAADARIDDQIAAGRYPGWVGPRRKWRLRRRYSAKVLALIAQKLQEWRPRVSSTSAAPHTPLAEAVGYALNQWSELSIIFETGDWPMHNNLAENVQRLIAVGRNYVNSWIMRSRPRQLRNIPQKNIDAVAADAHNHNACKKRMSLSGGRYRPACISGGFSRASARSFIPRSASTYMCVVDGFS
jgi:transposase